MRHFSKSWFLLALCATVGTSVAQLDVTSPQNFTSNPVSVTENAFPRSSVRSAQTFQLAYTVPAGTQIIYLNLTFAPAPDNLAGFANCAARTLFLDETMTSPGFHHTDIDPRLPLDAAGVKRELKRGQNMEVSCLLIGSPSLTAVRALVSSCRLTACISGRCCTRTSTPRSGRVWCKPSCSVSYLCCNTRF